MPSRSRALVAAGRAVAGRVIALVPHAAAATARTSAAAKIITSHQ
jgi:hypothetical protein